MPVPGILQHDLTWEPEGGRLLDADKRVIGVAYSGEAVKAQERALAAVGSAEWVMLDATDGAVCVPAENLIAAGKEAGTRVAVVAANAQQVAGLAGALQLGVDALVIKANPSCGDPSTDLWESALQAKKTVPSKEPLAGDSAADSKKSSATASNVQAAKVVSVTPVGGLGDRVCLDLIQLMNEGEGALVGSTAKALCVVQAETAQTGLVPPRPFRINAGPVHAYVAIKGGRTKYLSEVAAGDEIVIVDASAAVDGMPLPSRCIAVGRCKIEPRPVLCIRFAAVDDDTEGGSAESCRAGQIFLQQAETVRVTARRGGKE